MAGCLPKRDWREAEDGFGNQFWEPVQAFCRCSDKKPGNHKSYVTSYSNSLVMQRHYKAFVDAAIKSQVNKNHMLRLIVIHW